jgi:MFS family permease
VSRDPAGPSASPPYPKRSLLGAMAVVVPVSAGGSLPMFLTGALAVQMRQSLAFDKAALGAAVAAFLAAAALVAFPFGRLVDRVGPAVGMRAAMAVSTATSLGIALTADGWPVLVAWLAVGGMADALGQNAVNLYLTRAVDPRRQGAAFGAKQAAMPAASMLAGLAVPFVALTLGWRAAFVGAAVVAAVALVSVPRGRVHVRPPRRAPGSNGASGAALVLLAAGMGLGFGTAATLAAFLVDSSVAAGMSPGGAGVLLAAASALAMASRVLGGVLADRRGRGHLRVVRSMLLAGAVGYVALSTASVPLIVLGAALAGALGWGWNGLFFFAMVRLSPEAPATTAGAGLAGGFLGGVLVPPGFGLIAQHYGYRPAWLLAAAGAVLAAASVSLGRRTVLRRQALATQ